MTFSVLTATLISFYQDGEEYVRKRIRKLVEVTGKKTIISNSNWSEWSTDQGIISRVILKSGEREARIRFETEAKGNINRSLLPCSWGWTESSLQCRLMRGNIIKRVFFLNKKFKRLLTLSSVAS